jgi:hypothetical protein
MTVQWLPFQQWKCCVSYSDWWGYFRGIVPELFRFQGAPKYTFQRSNLWLLYGKYIRVLIIMWKFCYARRNDLSGSDIPTGSSEPCKGLKSVVECSETILGDLKEHSRLQPRVSVKISMTGILWCFQIQDPDMWKAGCFCVYRFVCLHPSRTMRHTAPDLTSGRLLPVVATLLCFCSLSTQKG